MPRSRSSNPQVPSPREAPSPNPQVPSPALAHISEEPGIRLFEPRHSDLAGEAVVWAIDDEHVRNYLLPRDCPRVTFYPLPTSDPADVARLMCGSAARAVVAIEAGWLQRALSCTLYRYDLPPDTFECTDPGAGYHVSREAVAPASVTRIDDPIGELLSRGVELRVLPHLWHLRDQVIHATLQFSMIRMRNAVRPSG